MPGASPMACLWVVDAQEPAMAAAAGWESRGVLAVAAGRFVLPRPRRPLCPRPRRGGAWLPWWGVTALGFLLPALVLLLSGTEGFIPFLCFIWKETLSLWLLLLLVVGVFAEIRPPSPCPPPGAAGSLPPLSDPPSGCPGWICVC